jgi:hypothetical protein
MAESKDKTTESKDTNPERIKRLIDELREDWDRKENNPHQQQNITLSISKAQHQLFQISGEQY